NTEIKKRACSPDPGPSTNTCRHSTARVLPACWLLNMPAVFKKVGWLAVGWLGRPGHECPTWENENRCSVKPLSESDARYGSHAGNTIRHRVRSPSGAHPAANRCCAAVAYLRHRLPAGDQRRPVGCYESSA